VLTLFRSERLDPPSEFRAEACNGAAVGLAACRECVEQRYAG
jgi:hypothetical protein